jgi:hypothetical protein
MTSCRTWRGLLAPCREPRRSSDPADRSTQGKREGTWQEDDVSPYYAQVVVASAFKIFEQHSNIRDETSAEPGVDSKLRTSNGSRRSAQRGIVRQSWLAWLATLYRLGVVRVMVALASRRLAPFAGSRHLMLGEAPSVVWRRLTPMFPPDIPSTSALCGAPPVLPRRSRG